MRQREPHIWIGVKDCGCYVAVCVDDIEHPGDVEKSKIDFIKDGLSVVRVTWQQWREDYMPKFLLDCPHKPLPSSSEQPALEL